MKIIDLKGIEMEVTNLDQAINQAKTFMKYTHANATQNQKEKDKYLKKYWTDIYNKLIQLKK